MRINVTAGDIAAGAPGNETHCPIALAVKRAIGAGEYAWVNDGRVELWDETYELSARAERFIAAFDAGEPVAPAQFRLRRVED